MKDLDKTKEELIKELQELQHEYNALKGSYDKDITERKRAEEALKISNERLEEAQRTTMIGNWEANIATGELYWSPVIF